MDNLMCKASVDSRVYQLVYPREQPYAFSQRWIPGCKFLAGTETALVAFHHANVILVNYFWHQGHGSIERLHGRLWGLRAVADEYAWVIKVRRCRSEALHIMADDGLDPFSYASLSLEQGVFQ